MKTGCSSALAIIAVLAVNTATLTAAELLFQDTFADGLSGWRGQGKGFKASAMESDYDDDGMARLDNSNGAKRAFLGVKVAPPDAALTLSFVAKGGTPGNTKVGIHRYAGPIKWVDIGQQWRRVSGELRSHKSVPSWYLVVPAGAVVYVDAVELRPFVLTEAEKAERRRAYRTSSEQRAIASYQSLDRVRPAPGTTLPVNGKFPVGFFTTRETPGRPLALPQIFHELASARLNLLHNSDFEDWPEHTEHYAKINSNATAARYLDEAHQVGLGVLMGFDRMMVLRSKLAGVRERVAALKDRPGLYGWYLMDEPTIHGASPETMRAAYRAVKKIDRVHPVVTTICRPERTRDYADSTDVIMVDAYPVSISPPFTLAIPIETALAVTGGTKPVWAAVQVHNNDLHHLRRGGETAHMISAPRFPTNQEIRCMTYLAIAHGASGILFYAYDGWEYGKAYDNEQRYRGILDLAREIDGLSDRLCADCLLKGSVRGEAGTLVSFIVRGRDEGNAVLIAVNGFDRSSGPVEVPMPGGEALRVVLAAHEVLIR